MVLQVVSHHLHRMDTAQPVRMYVISRDTQEATAPMLAVTTRLSLTQQTTTTSPPVAIITLIKKARDLEREIIQAKPITTAADTQSTPAAAEASITLTATATRHTYLKDINSL